MAFLIQNEDLDTQEQDFNSNHQLECDSYNDNYPYCSGSHEEVSNGRSTSLTDEELDDLPF